MAKTVTLVFSSIGIDADNFSLYTDIDGFTTPFEIGVTRASLLTGYTSTVVPDYTSTIRVQSDFTCSNYLDLVIPGAVPIDCSVTGEGVKIV